MDRMDRIKLWKDIEDYYWNIWSGMLQYEADFWRKARSDGFFSKDDYENEHINDLLKLYKITKYNFDNCAFSSDIFTSISQHLFRDKKPVYHARGLYFAHQYLKDAGFRQLFVDLENYVSALFCFRKPERPALANDYINGKINLDKEE